MEKCIIDEMNKGFCAELTLEEIESALHPTKAPGPDGMPTLFYQNNWYIVGKDISGLCLSLLKGDVPWSELNHTDIILVPKKTNPHPYVTLLTYYHV